MTKSDGARLLVVDDDEANRQTLFDLLSPRGYEVTLAEDGARALDLAEQSGFDLILLDITMPGIDGFEVLRRLRQSRGRNELPIIMATGRRERRHVVRALEDGANDYVTKPLDLPVVVARLRTQLSLKRAFDQIVNLKHDLKLQNARLEQANQQLESAYEQMKGDLRSAAVAQRALLPTALPEIAGVRFSWTFRPCADLAGDILNICQLDDTHVAFYLLDVSGHGVRAALLSVTLSHLLTPLPDQPSLLRRRTRGGGLEPTRPARVAEKLNRRFQLDQNNWQYFTLFYGVLNTRTHELCYVCAGQSGPLYVPRGGEPVDLSRPVLAIGWVPEPNYQEQHLQLQPGDRLYLYSDGIGEAKNAQNELFGVDRIVQALADGRALTLDQSTTRVLEEAESFSGRPFEDDVSALALEIENHPAALAAASAEVTSLNAPRPPLSAHPRPSDRSSTRPATETCSG